MTSGTEKETETPRQYLRRLGVEIDASDHRPIEEIAEDIARIFGHITVTNLDTGSENNE
jgi:hypothetical protein